MKHRDKILKLRNDGKSYNEIKNELNCSLGTIAYHCGENQKNKTKIRSGNREITFKTVIKTKRDNFSFVNGTRRDLNKRGKLDFTKEELIEKLLKDPTCYLTGRKIDLILPRTYCLDHIIPVSKGGTCEFKNLGLACRDANLSKTDMLLEEYLQLCKEVLIKNGYEVFKKDNNGR